MVPRAPAPSPLARAVYQSLTASPSHDRGFTLVEVMLVLGGLSLLSAGSFIVYQNSRNNADVRIEQSNIQQIAQGADRIYGSLGSYTDVSNAAAIGSNIPPTSMVSGSTSLSSRWNQPVLLEPTAVGSQPAAGLKITYQAVPAKACLKLAQAASDGMVDVEVGGQSVFSGGRLNIDTAITRCAAAPGGSAPMVFTYHGGSSGLAGTVLPPVSLPPLSPPTSPPPVAPPPAPPPVAPPPSPPAPGCGAAPPGAASGTTPAGQTCSFIWNSVAAPTCWAPLALCTPTVAPPPTAPPPSSPPGSPPPSTPPPGSPMCTVPSPSTRLCATSACVDGTDGSVDTTDNGTFTCPGGQLITTPGAYQYASSAPRTRTQTVTRNETASCPDPFDTAKWNASTFNPATYSPWVQTYACAPACVAPADTTGTQPGAIQNTSTPYSAAGTPGTSAGTPGTQSLACPAGQTGSITQTRTTTVTRSSTITRTGSQTRSSTQTRSVTYDCPSPVGAYTTAYGPWSAPGAPYGAWSAETYTPWSPPGAPYSAWSAPGAPYGSWVTTGNTCVTPPPAFSVCGAEERTELPGSGLGGPPSRACNASTLGMLAASTYISCGGAGCGGTGNLAQCQPAGWKIICGSGSAPYTGCPTPPGAPWDDLLAQGRQDNLDRTYGSGPSANYTTYSCVGTSGQRGDWRPASTSINTPNQNQPFFIRAEPGPAVPAACLVPPETTATNPLAKEAWRVTGTPDCPCTSSIFGARMTKGAAMDQNGSSGDGKEVYLQTTFTCGPAWTSY